MGHWDLHNDLKIQSILMRLGMRLNSLAIGFCVWMVAVSCWAADASRLSILGLKLGMTIDEVLEIYPTMRVDMVTHWGTGDMLFYTGTIVPEKINHWRVVGMYFSPFKQGKKLYRFSVEQFVGDNVGNQLEKKVIDKFGQPNCFSGKDDDSGGARYLVWGNCSGSDTDISKSAQGQFIVFRYGDARITLSMEDRAVETFIRKQVSQFDEETRTKEVLELDF